MKVTTGRCGGGCTRGANERLRLYGRARLCLHCTTRKFHLWATAADLVTYDRAVAPSVNLDKLGVRRIFSWAHVRLHSGRRSFYYPRWVGIIAEAFMWGPEAEVHIKRGLADRDFQLAVLGLVNVTVDDPRGQDDAVIAFCWARWAPTRGDNT